MCRFSRFGIVRVCKVHCSFQNPYWKWEMTLLVSKNHKTKYLFRITIFLLKFLSSIDITVVWGEWSLTSASRPDDRGELGILSLGPGLLGARGGLLAWKKCFLPRAQLELSPGLSVSRIIVDDFHRLRVHIMKSEPNGKDGGSKFLYIWIVIVENSRVNMGVLQKLLSVNYQSVITFSCSYWSMFQVSIFCF